MRYRNTTSSRKFLLVFRKNKIKNFNSFHSAKRKPQTNSYFFALLTFPQCPLLPRKKLKKKKKKDQFARSETSSSCNVFDASLKIYFAPCLELCHERNVFFAFTTSLGFNDSKVFCFVFMRAS